MPSGVKVKEITLGTGALAERGTAVTIHYRGFLHRGDQFRSSYDEGRPLRVHLGRRVFLIAYTVMLHWRESRP
jgi:FKBP-type peptidyl-prolyl cis-trans isomerase